MIKNRNKWMAALLLMTFLCMAFAPGAVFADTTASADAVTDEEQAKAEEEAKAAEEAKKREEAAKRDVINTGLDPLWSFVNINAPEQVLVGQKFDIEVTVKNMGSGSGLFPVFRFTEEADKKALSHFTIIGGSEDGQYDTLLTEIPGGETKTFTITMQVNPETKELPEGSKYRINCMIASDNWRMTDDKRYNAVKSFELDVVYALAEPSFVVEKVTFNPEVTAGVEETVATLTLKNISDSKANNVVVTLEGMTSGEEGEKNIAVRDLTATKQLYNVSGKQKVTVDYTLAPNKDRKHTEVKLTVDYNGAEKPQEILLNMPLPLQESVNGREPKVIIERYTVEPGKVLAGNYVTLTLYVENTNSLPVNNVSIQLDVPTETSSNGGTVSSGTVFSPVDSSNTFYVDRIEGKYTAVKTINMYVDPNATAKTYTVPVDIQYEGTDGKKYSSQDNVNIPVTQESKVEIISTNIQEMGNVGEPLNILVEFVNVGKVNLTNFKVRLEGDVPGKEENVFYLGTFNAGESNEYSASIIPEEEGTLAGTIQMSYIDADNQNAMLEIPFSCEIGPMIEYEPVDMPMEPIEEPGLLDQLRQHWLPLVLGLVIIAQGVVLFRMKKKAKAEEELIDG